MFCNTMPLYCQGLNIKSHAVKNLTRLIDKTKYFKINNGNQAFYIKYKNMGYANPKANTGMVLEAFRDHANIKHLAQLLESDLLSGNMNTSPK